MNWLLVWVVWLGTWPWVRVDLGIKLTVGMSWAGYDVTMGMSWLGTRWLWIWLQLGTSWPWVLHTLPTFICRNSILLVCSAAVLVKQNDKCAWEYRKGYPSHTRGSRVSVANLATVANFNKLFSKSWPSEVRTTFVSSTMYHPLCYRVLSHPWFSADHCIIYILPVQLQMSPSALYAVILNCFSCT